MDLQRAYETLGLTRDASVEAVEAAHEQLRGDYERRIARASTTAIKGRYREAQAELDAARDVVRSSQALRGEGAEEDDALALAHAVLGLTADATPLDVASAYVSLCEELERELETAPTEALRRRCREARAEVDEAYRYCIALLHPGAAAEDTEPYQTQMSREPFEATVTPEPEVMIVAPDESDLDPVAMGARPAGRGRLRLARVAGATLASLCIAALTFLAIGWATGADVLAEVRSLLPDQPDPRIVRAQSDAELARRRVGQEQETLKARAQEASERVEGLTAALAEEDSAEERVRLRAELTRARARHALAVDLSDLAERYIFGGSDLSLAYGRIELGHDLSEASRKRRALSAYAEAERLIEGALAQVDLAEQALGARSEAVAARDAWVELQSDAALPDSQAADQGNTVLAGALALLSGGSFGEAAGELERAAQLYRVALDDGRRQVAAAVAPEPDVEEGAQVGAEEPEGVDIAVDSARAVGRRLERSLAARQPAVSSAPPEAAAQRQAIKLVAIAGDASLPAFRIDRTEVRVDEYAACVRAGSCSQPARMPSCNWNVSGRGDHPINCVDWEQALDYCGWVGKRLPSDQEWERAARGVDGRAFPWGDADPSCERAVIGEEPGRACGLDSTSPVASLDAGRSPDGLFDMAGNVLEWTADWDDGWVVVRGGSWRTDLSSRAWRGIRQATTRNGSLGFRCAGAAMIAEAR